MRVYRICRKKYANDLSGSGAQKTGGRWNSKGVRILYTANSIATATVELAVHLPLGIIPRDYVLVTMTIPETIKPHEIKVSELPKDWNSINYTDATQRLGDQLITEQKHLLLKVPSASVKGEFNILMNPMHPQFNKVKVESIEPYSFDVRLFKR